MTKPARNRSVLSTTTAAIAAAKLPEVRGGAYEGYLEIEFEKQGKSKGTNPR